MKTVIISGSNRKDSQSLRVAEFLKERIDTLTVLESEIIDLHKFPFSTNPDDNFYGKQDEHLEQISQIVETADSLVIISPEWSGAASPILKALLIFIGRAAAYKPALLVGVSAGRGGFAPIIELKSNGNKNNFITFIPEYLIFRQVHELFKNTPPTDKEEIYIHERTDYAIKILFEFSKAHQLIRSSGVLDLKKYFFGIS
jgi:NAD(P)H-dependent FMN reductase